MKLPRGAFRMGQRSAYYARAEFDGKVSFTRYVADPRDDGTLAAGPYDLVEGWRPTDGYVITRQETRKFIRRLIAAIEHAEAIEHASKLLRKGRRRG